MNLAVTRPAVPARSRARNRTMLTAVGLGLAGAALIGLVQALDYAGRPWTSPETGPRAGTAASRPADAPPLYYLLNSQPLGARLVNDHEEANWICNQHGEAVMALPANVFCVATAEDAARALSTIQEVNGIRLAAGLSEVTVIDLR